MNIKKIHARQILDSRGYPTIESDVELEDGSLGRAAVPSGVSTGMNEALELRDQDPNKFGGRGVLKAVENVKGEISRALVGMDVFDQIGLDTKMIELDGTENKSRLGANAILSVSLASAYAAAASKKIALFKYLNSLTSIKVDPIIPIPLMNIINGGMHANWVTDIQEYMIYPFSAKNFSQALEMGTNVFITLGEVLKEKGYALGVGDEGGYAPLIRDGNLEPLELISEAVSRSGYTLGTDIVLALDFAASEFFSDGKYHFKWENKILDSLEMIDFISFLVDKYPIISVEDCLSEQDWEGWENLTNRLGNKVQIVGDDLFVTNTKFLQKGIEEKAANAILIKLNQIGTLTETIKTVEMAHQAGWSAIISHRSGETEDTTIAHLSVALATGQIKSGSMCRSERVCKYNELLRIEEILGVGTKFVGKEVFKKWRT